MLVWLLIFWATKLELRDDLWRKRDGAGGYVNSVQTPHVACVDSLGAFTSGASGRDVRRGPLGQAVDRGRIRYVVI
jgi:hypothetical protein